MTAGRPRERALALDPPSAVAAAVRALPSGRSLLVGFAVLAVAVGAYAAARGTSLFAVRSFEVSGASPRVTTRVEHALEPLAGQSLLKLGVADVDEALKALPEVDAVALDRHFPSTLRVVVEAERPVAVLRRGADAWLVSERGRILQALPAARPKRLPRIWVERLPAPQEGSVPAATEVVAPARVLGQVLTEDRELLLGLREARARAGNVELVLRSGMELRLGAPADIALKLAVAKQVLAALPPLAAGYVDVSAPERPVAAAEPQVSG